MYIKYDKNLIVNIDSLVVKDQIITIYSELDYNDGKYIVDFKNLVLPKYKLKIKGIVKLSYDEIKSLLESYKHDLEIESLVFEYDKNIKPVLAKKAFLDYKNNNLYLTFIKPSFDGIKLDNSRAIIYDITTKPILELDLYTKSILNKSLENILSYYNIKIPIKQIKGENDIHVYLKIPFHNLDNIIVDVNGNIKNAIIKYEDLVVDVYSSQIKFKKYLQINSKAGKLDFKDYLFQYNDLNLSLKDSVLQIDTNLQDSLNNKYFATTQTNLNSLQTKGVVDIKDFTYKHYVSLQNKKIPFSLQQDSNNSLRLSVKSLALDYKKNDNNNSLYIGKLNKLVPYMNFAQLLNTQQESILELNSSNDFENIDIKIDNLYVDINSSKLFKESNDSSEVIPTNVLFENGHLVYDGFPVKYKKISFDVNDSQILYKSSFYDDKDNSFVVDGILDPHNKTSEGNFIFVKYKYENVTKVNFLVLDFNASFKDKIIIKSEHINLEYVKDGQKHSLNIKNLDDLVKYIPNIYKNHEKNSSIQVHTNDNFNKTHIVANNLYFDVNSSIFVNDNNDKEDKGNQKNFEVKAFDSAIKYEDFIIDSSVIELSKINNKIDIQLIPYDKKGSFHFNKFNEDVSIYGHSLSASFIDKLMQKNKLAKGKFFIDLKGDMNYLKGLVKLEDTVVRNVPTLTNLITFINTTPAFYAGVLNPVLLIPTVLRMGETNFDTSGYYIRNGTINVDFDVQNKYLKLPSIFTRGTMNDFIGKGWIDFKAQKQEYNMDVVFLKDYANVIKHIPLVNYIILGKDGTFKTSVDIKGDFEEQSFKTHAIENTTKGVLGVITRTISLPFLPFMGDNNSTNEINGTKIYNDISKPNDKNN